MASRSANRQLGGCAPATASVTSGLSPALLHQVAVPPHDRGGGDDPMQSADSGR